MRIAHTGDSLRKHVDRALLWQIARGWLLAVAIAVVIGQIGNTSSWGYAHAWLPHAGFRGTGAGFALVAIVAVSVVLGRRAAAGRGSRSIALPARSP